METTPPSNLRRRNFSEEKLQQPIRTRYLRHVTGYQPVRDQYFLVRSVPVLYLTAAVNTSRTIQLTVAAEPSESVCDATVGLGVLGACMAVS